LSKYSQLPPDFPKPLESLLKFSEYSRGDSRFSVTDLLKPVQIVQLTRRHSDEIVTDPRENIYRVLGSAVHGVLEKTGLENPESWQLIEKRLHATINDVPISGQIDLHSTYENGILTDWKHCKTSVLKFGAKKEWAEQLNGYAHLLRKHGYEVKSARVCAIFRDWAQSGINGLWKATTTDGVKITCKKTPDYPEWGCELIPIELWPDEEVERFLEQQVLEHTMAESFSDEWLPECTPEERWRRDVWRVRKRGAVKARGNKSNFKTEQEAREYQTTMGEEFEVSYRAGVPIRCIFYCPCLPFCKQVQREGLEVEWVQEDAEEEPAE
jgi:hypothetical protein